MPVGAYYYGNAKSVADAQVEADHVIKTQMNFGLMYSFLYVSEYIEEWKMDMEDLGDNQTLAYVVNTTMPDCSEFGTIGIEPSIGGLKRIW